MQWSAGENIPPANVPQALKDYCQALLNVPPSHEYFIGDADYDLKTLHASAGFRDAFARLDIAQHSTHGFVLERAALHKEIVVNWLDPEQHEISSDGTRWVRVRGTALKYKVTYTPSIGPSQAVFMSIQYAP